MERIKTFIFCFIVATIWHPKTVNAQVAPEYYLIEFTDKMNSSYTLNNPEEFLSPRAIARRARQNIEVKENDLPVSKYYIDSLKKYDIEIHNISKWFNSVVVYAENIAVFDEIKNLGFVKKVYINNKYEKNKLSRNKFAFDKNQQINYGSIQYNLNDYGASFEQIEQVNGHLVHQEGFMGEGMQIAIFDAGFVNANQLSVFDSIWDNNRILGTKDFVDGGEILFDKHYHGTAVFSIIGANNPGVFIGTAPKASFWLFRTENTNSEYRIEEENWISAAEFADSAGVDVFNTSLGYSTFDDISQNYTFADMNGNTARISIASKIAASKGIIVVTSAGNEGNTNWQHITAPADADSILTIGSVDFSGSYASFSSIGPSADGRVKPNICAQGSPTLVQTQEGDPFTGSGTSFSSPIIAGMAACLWQAFPEASNMEIIETIESSSSQYDYPDNFLGNGIPDFSLALKKLSNKYADNDKSKLISVYPTFFNNDIYFDFYSYKKQEIIIQLIDTQGNIILRENKSLNLNQTYYHHISGINNLLPGLYILIVSSESDSFHKKIYKY